MNDAPMELSLPLPDDARDAVDPSAPPARAADAAAANIVWVDPDTCRVSAMNTRRSDWLTDDNCSDLIDEIDHHGVLVPLIGRVVEAGDNSFEIIAGARRLYSAQRVKACGKNIMIPVEIRVLTDREACVLIEAENCGRTNPSPIERAQGYERQLACFMGGQNAFAREIGIDKGDFSRLRSLLVLPDELLGIMTDPREMSLSQGASLAKLYRKEDTRAIMMQRAAAIKENDVKLPIGEVLAQMRTAMHPKKAMRQADPVLDERGAEVGRIERRTNGRLQITIERLDSHSEDERRALVKTITKTLSGHLLDARRSSATPRGGRQET